MEIYLYLSRPFGTSTNIGVANNWREAASIARRELEQHGRTVKREHNMPGVTDRLWVATGGTAVHAVVTE